MQAVKALSLFTLLSLTLLLGMTLIQEVDLLFRFPEAHAESEVSKVRGIGKQLAKAINEKDLAAIEAISDANYFKKIKGQIPNAAFGSFECAEPSAQVFDDVACVYLMCKRFDMHFLVLVSCRKVQGQWQISYGPILKYAG